VNKNSKTYQAIKPLANLLLEGTILSIDPSTGSSASLPGFAWFSGGELIESGVLEVDYRLSRSIKLYEIARTIREDFNKPDILLVEQISTIIYRGSKMNATGMAGLQKAIGAIIGARPFEHVIEIPASAWRSYKPDNYVKSDEMDAVTIGLCATEVAKEVIENEREGGAFRVQKRPRGNKKKSRRNNKKSRKS